MAITKIADVIVPELFNRYVINRTMELSAFFQSGIVVNSPKFDALASEAARTHNMPFFEDLQGESEAILEDVKMTAKKIGSNKDVSTTIYRQNMWGASNLSAALAGADPMKASTPESIYNEPENAFVADFIGDSNIVDGLMVHDKLVRIADYDFECVDVGFGTNRPVDVQIRPEDMELRPAREGGFNGVVTKVIFEGMNYNITIQARNIEWLVKSTKNYEPGDEVSLEVDPFNIQIMNKPESEDERAMEND